MTNSIEIELAGSTKKFISVGNQTFLNSKGQTETCRKGLKGQHCQRHHGGSVTSFAEAREKLDAFAERTAEKLSPFENGCVWLYSLLMRIPLEEARSRYINATAMYALMGVRKPHESEVKGLQKILLKLADVSQVTSTRMDNLKRLIKKMTVGNGFSEAGFYSIKDMVKDSTMKLKLGMAGVGVAGVFTLTGCSGNPIADKIASTSYDSFKVNNESGIDKLTFFEETSDEFGKYTRTYVVLPKDFKLAGGQSLDADARAALETAVKFTTLESIDSIALDNPSRWEEWKTNVAPKYISSSYITALLSSNPVDASSPSTIIFSAGTDIMPNLIRDGGVRIADKRLSSITVSYNNGTGAYDIKMDGSALIYSDDKSAAPWISSKGEADSINVVTMSNPDGTPMSKEEQASYYKNAGGTPIPSEYSDGANNSMILSFQVSYSMVKEGNAWKIAGYSNSFTNTVQIKSGNSEQLGYRNNIIK